MVVDLTQISETHSNLMIQKKHDREMEEVDFVYASLFAWSSFTCLASLGQGEVIRFNHTGYF